MHACGKHAERLNSALCVLPLPVVLECVGDSRISHVQVIALELLSALLSNVQQNKCLAPEVQASVDAALKPVASSGKSSVLRAKAEHVLSHFSRAVEQQKST